MEPKPEEAEPTVDRSHYHSSLLMCFVLSIGICCAVLPIIPFENSDTDSPRGDLTYTITRFCLTLILLFFEIFFWYVVRKRDSFHTKQEVFWPLRCQHCALAVGRFPQLSQDGNIYSSRRHFESRSCHRLPVAKNNEDETLSLSCPNASIYPVKQVQYQQMFRRSKSLDEVNITASQYRDVEGLSEWDDERKLDNCLLKPKADHENVTASSSSRRKAPVSNEVHYQLYCKPHMSLLNTFCIFGTVAAINIPLPIIANIVCLITLDNSLFNEISLLAQVLLDFTFTTLILFAMLFFRNFYDAAFIDKRKFSLCLAVVFASSFWIAVVKIIYPLGEILSSRYGNPDYPCYLPGKYGIFTSRHERTLTPFYAECAIIAAAMTWQMWHSILPRSCLKRTNCTSQFQRLGPTYFKPFSGKICARLKDIFRCRWLKLISLGSNKEQRRSLLPRSSDGHFQEPSLNVGYVLAICITLGITYFSVRQVFDHSDMGLQETPSATESTLIYLKWFLQILFYLPLLVMYRYRIFLTNSANSFCPRKTVSLVSGLMGGHDRIILLSCLGVFTLNIFRLVSAVGILVRISRPREYTVLACYTCIFAIFQTYSAWVMTSFLVVVQRQQMRGSDEAKWTSICLIYTGILNATHWLIESVDIASWVELTMFYGPTQGMVIGVLLEPLTSLYGIHSAMIAYEAYKTIRNEFQSRRKSVALESC